MTPEELWILILHYEQLIKKLIEQIENTKN